MIVSVIGTGKTGSAVAELLGDKARTFNSKNKPTAEKLAETDVAIVFVTADAAPDVVEEILGAEIPAVWGTTGYQWPADLPEKVKDTGGRWVIGSNFSLGMNLVRKAITLFGKGAALLKDASFHIHEVHHVHKKDAPSGTALSWQEWLDRDATISSDRQGDVKGIHRLSIKTKNESIMLEHEAESRALFAEGAVWTAEFLLKHPHIDAGVYKFESIFERAYNETI